jgi:hypothetical protein
MSTNENRVKVLFNFYSNAVEEQTVETMWAEIVDQDKGVFKLDSIPFYALNLAYGDTFIAVYNSDEQMLTYKEKIVFSGNSTVQVAILDHSVSTNCIRRAFHALGCETEMFKERYFVIDVPAELDYFTVKSKLQELSGIETIDYAESCLSAQHRH